MPLGAGTDPDFFTVPLQCPFGNISEFHVYGINPANMLPNNYCNLVNDGDKLNNEYCSGFINKAYVDSLLATVSGEVSDIQVRFSQFWNIDAPAICSDSTDSVFFIQYSCLQVPELLN